MSRIAPLYKVESFRGSVADLLEQDAEALAELRAASLDRLTATATHEPITSGDELVSRAFGLLHEAALRDGVTDVGAELRAAFPDALEDNVARLLASLTPDDDDKERVTGIDERDAFLPILTSHRFALDLRVTEGAGGLPIATPFVSARLEFDSSVAAGVSAIVFQLNLADIEGLTSALTSIRERAGKLIAGSADMTIPEWGHGLSL
ncbi:hypothetical protein [Microbacterium sp. MMO-113]|uniref:hypothetical protein n=1 Tax=Microbacterium sp. MMO-113 TaxID=3081273 RepID=UPI00301AD8A9